MRATSSRMSSSREKADVEHALGVAVVTSMPVATHNSQHRSRCPHLVVSPDFGNSLSTSSAQDAQVWCSLPVYHLSKNNHRNACRFYFCELILICNDCMLIVLSGQKFVLTMHSQGASKNTTREQRRLRNTTITKQVQTRIRHHHRHQVV